MSGLVSRSVLNHQVPTGAFHGCVIYSDLAKYDQTRAFIERVAQHLGQHTEGTTLPSEGELTRQRFLMQEMLGQIQRDYGINDINHIKPGIAEATRVMLRRVPALLIVRDASHPDVEHLMLLAEEKACL